MKNVRIVKISRRDMLKLSGSALGAAVLAACGASDEDETTDTTADDSSADDSSVDDSSDDSSSDDAPAPTEEAPAPEVAEIVMMYLANEISEDEIAQFNADYSNVNLTRVDLDTTRFFAMFASGESPDLLRTMAPDLPQYLARNIMLPLDDYFSASNVLSMDDLVDANNYYKLATPTDVGQGPIYGMAKDWAPDTFLWVNEAVFEAAGVTPPDWTEPPTSEEVAAVAREVTTKDGDLFVTTGINGHVGFIERFWMTLASMAGGSLFNDDLTAATIVGNEAAEGAIAWFHDIAKDGAMNSAINPSPAWFGPDFVEGRLAIVYTGYWFHGNLLGDPNEEFQQNVADGKIKMYPHMTHAGTRSHPCVTAAGAIISQGSANPDAAWDVFEWYMGKEPADARASSGWGLPALESKFDLIPTEGPLSGQAWESIQADLPHAGEVLSFNPYIAGGEPSVPGQVFLDNWEQLLNDEISFDDMLQRIESETNIAIEEGIDRVG